MSFFSNSTDNTEIVKNVYDFFAKGEIPQVLEFFDKDIIWTDMEGFPTGGTYVGAGAILNGVFIKLGTEWNNFQANPDEYLKSEDRVTVLGHYQGTYKATGKSMKVPFAHVWSLREGKIVKFLQYTDTLLVSKVL